MFSRRTKEMEAIAYHHVGLDALDWGLGIGDGAGLRADKEANLKSAHLSLTADTHGLRLGPRALFRTISSGRGLPAD